MLALLRLLVFGFLVLSVVFVCLSFYSRSVRKGKLEQWWEDEGRPGDKDAYIDQGLRDYEGTLRRKLIWGVYVVPIVVITIVIYFTNFH